MDYTISGVILGWFLGVLSQSLTNDKSAIALTRQQFLAFGISLNKIFYQLMNQHRSGTHDFRSLQEIQELLQRLECIYADVFIEIPQLKQLIYQSWEILRRYEENPNEWPIKCTTTLGELKTIWMWSEGKNIPMDEVKKILYAGFLKRLCYRIEYSLRPILKWARRSVYFVLSDKR